MDIRMRDMDGLEASKRILAQMPVPIVILTGFSQPEFVEKADAAGVAGYLVKPVSEGNLLAGLAFARSRFRQLQTRDREIEDLKEAIRSRKLVEQAKGILMEAEGLTEAEAFTRIQKQSRSQNIPMAKLAEALITANKLLKHRPCGNRPVS
jgi:response regulator NasT